MILSTVDIYSFNSSPPLYSTMNKIIKFSSGFGENPLTNLHYNKVIIHLQINIGERLIDSRGLLLKKVLQTFVKNIIW